MRHLLSDEHGLGRLEWLGIVGTIVAMLMFVPPVRGAIADAYIPNIWDDTFASGILIGIGSFVIFGGAVYLVLYTNLGAKLGFLVAGAGLFGFGAISGLLFVLYAPRGPRPENIDGLNAFQIRIIPGAMMLGSALLFAMFLAALSRVEAADAD